jgi:hypothetical protein
LLVLVRLDALTRPVLGPPKPLQLLVEHAAVPDA